MTRRHRWWPRSLRRQLVIGVSAIVSVALIGVGVVAVMSLRDEVVSVSDSLVADSLAAFSYSYAKSRQKHLHPQPPDSGADAGGLTDYTGQAPGTIIALLGNGTVAYATVFTEGEPAPAPPDVVRELEATSWKDGSARTMKLGSLGPHRVGSRDLGDGARLVSGVSLEVANKTVARKTAIVAGLVVLALLATAMGTVVVVRYALKPLRRVAAVAARVAALPLDGEHRISARVSEGDTDPDTEVGIVGQTLNRLLANVDAALSRMAESDRRMRQFLTDASHELRTPLAAISGYAELTRQDSAVLPPTTEYALARIEAESRRMTTLVSDLLLLSRLDEGQDLQIEDIDLCDLVADAVNDIAVTAPEHHFVVDLPDDPVWVRGDRARLHQLLGNLLGNARVHTPAGVTVTTSVATRAENAGEMVELVVSDDGPGIPGELMPNLFGRFVRADKSRSRELGCSGLGLAIVLSIVEAHKGTVSAESRPGRTVFTVRLPAAPRTGSDAARNMTGSSR